MTLFKPFAAVFLVGTILLTLANQAAAQCSNASRGGTSMPTSSAGFPAAISYTAANSLAMQQTLAYQRQQALAMQQLYQQQQQLLAMRRQQTQQLAQQRYEQQQEIFAGRLARAEAKRAQRAERIAARLELRDSNPSSGSSGTLLVSSEIDTSIDEHPFR